MARSDFIKQLQAMGHIVEERGENRLAFSYTIPVGKHVGKEIRLGFDVSDDFPMNPPSGPHISPRLHEIHPGSDLPHPRGGVHESPFGSDWQYWSRPFHAWPTTERNVRAYLAFINQLFDKQ